MKITGTTLHLSYPKTGNVYSKPPCVVFFLTFHLKLREFTLITNVIVFGCQQMRR